METAATSFYPRLSEASRLLPLLRDCLLRAAPRPFAATLDLLPIIEDGLFGYELVPDRETHVYPIIGRNARGEAVVRKNSYDVVAGTPLHLVTVNGVPARNAGAARQRVKRRDARFPDYFAATASAWEQILALGPDRPRPTPILNECAHQWLDRALCAAHSYLHRWDPFIEFLGLPNEAERGFALIGRGSERGELILRRPGTWALRWDAPQETVRKSWSLNEQGPEASGEGANDYGRSHDRRAQLRRATDRGRLPDSWVGVDRRRTHGRRAMDQHAT